MITQYGMSEKFGLIGLESVQSRYLDGRPVMNCGEATAAAIDGEVMDMLKKAYKEAKRLLTENREALDKIAAFLIEKETITGKEFMKIFREVKGIEEPSKELNDSKEVRIQMNEGFTLDGKVEAKKVKTEEAKAEEGVTEEAVVEETVAKEVVTEEAVVEETVAKEVVTEETVTEEVKAEE